MTWVLIVAAVAVVWLLALLFACALCRAAAAGDRLMRRARADVAERARHRQDWAA